MRPGGGHALPHRQRRHDVEQGQPLDPAGMVERQPIADARPAIMPHHGKAQMPQRLHHRHDIAGHRALAVGLAPAIAMGRRRPAIAAQIGADHGVRLGQLGRQPVPFGMGLREAVDQHHRRPLATDAGKNPADLGIDPVALEAGEEAVEIAHGGILLDRPSDPRAFSSEVETGPPDPAGQSRRCQASRSRFTACQPISRRQNPPGQSITSTPP